MSKFKKLTLTCIAVLSAFIFVACSNGVDATSDDKPAGNPEISLSYNKDVYKYKVEDVLKAGEAQTAESGIHDAVHIFVEVLVPPNQ